MHSRCCLVLALLLPLWVCSLPAEEPAASAQSLPKKAEFGRVLAQWKDLLSELAILQVEYRQADDQRRAEIRREWDPLIEKGDALEPQLIAAAEEAFMESPNADVQVTDLLVDVLIGHVRASRYRPPTDDYEEARRLADLLIENGCQDKGVFAAAGIAAFALQDFDTAEEYLKLARESKVTFSVPLETLDNLLDDFLGAPEQYKEAWEKEQEIRRVEAEADDLPRVLLRTNKGDIELELFENQAPNTVANFISLVEKGFYDGLTFHRVLPAFMAQSGCPEGNGYGGPGYHIPCECHPPHEFRLHFRGSLSMAHGGRDTGGSQFFITFVPTSHLDGVHTVFGRVISGFEVLHKLQRRDPEAEGDLPDPDIIVEAKVLRKRDHPYTPVTISQ